MMSPVAAPREIASDPHDLRLSQVLSMGVMRFAVLTAATSIAPRWLCSRARIRSGPGCPTSC